MTALDADAGSATGRAEFLDRIRTALPGIRARAASIEALGRAHDETIAELSDAGLLAGLQPRRWGGLELDPATFLQGAVLVGSACASAGWVGAVLGMHPWEVACMHPAAQEEVWGDDRTARISSSYAPTGTAAKDGPGSYRISGWWGFSSGVDHATWALLGAIVDGEEHLGPRVFLVSKSDFVIDHASWDVTGLSGTGSKALRVAEVRIPAHRTHLIAEFNDPAHQRPGWLINPGPLYRFSFGDLFSWGIGAPAIGAVTGFAEEWVRQTRERLPATGGSRAAERPEIHLRLAEGLNRVELLNRSMVSFWSELYERLENGEPLDPVAQSKLQYLGSRSISDALEAALGMFATSGGGVMFRDNPLQRFLRDLLAMRNHPIANLERFARESANTILT